MKVNSDNEDHNSVIIAMEIGYQALADLASYYKEVNDQLLKQMAIWEGKSVKEMKKEVNFALLTNGKEKDLLAKIKASQEVIKRFNESKKEKNA
jgi:hypothetical protein